MKYYTPEETPLESDYLDQLNEDLKNILLIGDSISIGYTPVVRELFRDQFNVFHPDVNCGDTRFGLEKIMNWLGDRQWDVIHFNWGLHDLCYRHPESNLYGNKDKIRGTISISLDEYKRNLARLVEVLKETGATLIWANTTLIPDGESGRKAGEEIIYNYIALKIMEENKIYINDLNALTSSFSTAMFTKQGDVHYSQEGYKIIGHQVVKEIMKALTSENL